MAVDVERHLLVGLLALQNGFIDQAQLLAAFQAWARDRARPLADRLEEHGALNGPRRAAIEALALLHIEAHGSDPARSLAALRLEASTREELGAAGGPEIEATLAHVGTPTRGARGADVAAETCSFGDRSDDGQRFRVLRLHARGGLGAVFVALDAEVHREVALKQILERHADDPVSRQRFLLEAEITGGLEHPGIVPVYGLGTYANGRPFYAMRFIRGENLRDAIDRAHADGALRDPRRRPLELRKLLRRFVDVCNAVEYAHSRGVIHRDLKPSNVVVGRHGETLVVDWGLAKATGRGGAGPDGDERPLRPASTAGSSETLPGSALGTPAFMSPEQARGDLDALGPASDVYSLGATLFYLLTGRAAFGGDDVAEVLARVRAGRFTAPRDLDPTLDRALEAVCLRAMAADPADRYASPRALADDLERWMADEPVAAWREPWTRTLVRGLTRHRTAVTAAGAAGLVALIGTAAVLAVQTRFNAQLAGSLARERSANVALGRANAALSQSRLAAQARYELAMDAMATFHTGVSRDFLLQQPQFRTLRDRLLRKAGRFYEKMADLVGGGADPASRRAFWRANFELAALTTRVGQARDALEAHRRVLAGREALAAEPGADPASRLDVARSLLALQASQVMVGDFAAALDSAQRALTLAGPLVDAPSLADDARAAVAEAHLMVADAQFRARRLPEALAAAERARDAYGAWIRGRPDDAEARADFARAVAYVGGLLGELGRYEQSRPTLERARDLFLALAEAHPDEAGYRQEVARADANLAVFSWPAGRRWVALAAHERAAENWQRAAEALPAVATLQNNFAWELNGFARFLIGALDRPDRALPLLERSTAILRAIVDADGLGFNYVQNLDYACYLRSVAELRLGHPEAAPAAYEPAVAACRRRAEALPEDVGARDALARSLVHSCGFLAAAGRAAEGVRAASEALTMIRRTEGGPDASGGLTWLRPGARLVLAQAHRRLGLDGEAAADARAALDDLAALGGADRYAEACARAILAGLAGRQGSGVAVGEGPALADRALDDLRAAVEADPALALTIRVEPPLDALRADPRFQLLLLDLAIPDDPFGPQDGPGGV